MITVVSGLPRSGTSMMMRMLESGGMPVLADGVRAADRHNPTGYYEFEPVKRLDKDSSWVSLACNKAVKVIYVLLYHLPRKYRYRVIFMKRNLEEVIASQNAMLPARGDLTDRQLVDSFERQLQELYLWLEQQDNFATLYLDYSEVLAEPERAAMAVSRFLRIPLDTQAMTRAVDPSLYRNRSGPITAP